MLELNLIGDAGKGSDVCGETSICCMEYHGLSVPFSVPFPTSIDKLDAVAGS